MVLAFMNLSGIGTNTLELAAAELNLRIMFIKLLCCSLCTLQWLPPTCSLEWSFFYV